MTTAIFSSVLEDVFRLTTDVDATAADALFLDALRSHPDLLEARFPAIDSLPLSLATAPSSAHEISQQDTGVAVFAFRQRLIHSLLHVLDTGGATIDHPFFDEAPGGWIEGPSTTLLAACIERATLRPSFRATRDSAELARLAAHVAPYTTLAVELLARGARVDLMPDGIDDVAQEALIRSRPPIWRLWKAIGRVGCSKLLGDGVLLGALINAGAQITPVADRIAVHVSASSEDRALVSRTLRRLIEAGLDLERPRENYVMVVDSAGHSQGLEALTPFEQATLERNPVALAVLLDCGARAEGRGFRYIGDVSSSTAERVDLDEAIAGFADAALIAKYRATRMRQTMNSEVPASHHKPGERSRAARLRL